MSSSGKAVLGSPPEIEPALDTDAYIAFVRFLVAFIVALATLILFIKLALGAVAAAI